MKISSSSLCCQPQQQAQQQRDKSRLPVDEAGCWLAASQLLQLQFLLPVCHSVARSSLQCGCPKPLHVPHMVLDDHPLSLQEISKVRAVRGRTSDAATDEGALSRCSHIKETVSRHPSLTGSPRAAHSRR